MNEFNEGLTNMNGFILALGQRDNNMDGFILAELQKITELLEMIFKEVRDND